MDPRLAGRWPSVQTVPLVDVWNPRLTLVNQQSVVQLFPERVHGGTFRTGALGAAMAGEFFDSHGSERLPDGSAAI